MKHTLYHLVLGTLRAAVVASDEQDAIALVEWESALEWDDAKVMALISDKKLERGVLALETPIPKRPFEVSTPDREHPDLVLAQRPKQTWRGWLAGFFQLK